MIVTVLVMFMVVVTRIIIIIVVVVVVGQVHAGFWWGNLRYRDHMEYLRVDGKIILKWSFRNWMGTWTGFI
jgi:hypothetical protein